MITESDQVEGCLASFYGVISGRSGDTRDWSKFRDLFIANAALSIRRTDDQGYPQISTYRIKEYIQNLQKFLAARDFFEYSTCNDIRFFGDICSVINEYAAYTDADRQAFLKKGKNIVSLVFDGTAWKIASMLWQDGA